MLGRTAHADCSLKLKICLLIKLINDNTKLFLWDSFSEDKLYTI